MLISVSARDFTQDYNNPLTRSISDYLYCKINDSCSLQNLTVIDLVVLGNFTSVNVTIFNINLSNYEGEHWVNETGDSMTGNLNMTNNNITNVDVLQVRNITGFSPVTFDTNVIIGYDKNISAKLFCDASGNCDDVIAFLRKANLTGLLNQSEVNATIDERVQDIWVNESGDSMTGNLNMTDNNISDVSILRFGGNETFIFINQSNKSMNFVVNNRLQLILGSSIIVPVTATFQDSIFGDGSTLLNVCLPNGSTVNGFPCNATSVFSVDEIWINNINGNATFNESKLNSTVRGILNITQTEHSVGVGPFLYNVEDVNKTNIFLNDSYLNTIIDNRTGFFEINFSVSVIGGEGSNQTTFTFPRLAEVFDVTVTPTTPTNKYRFRANGTTGTVVDEDRIPHVGTWLVTHRGVFIQNENIAAYITEATIDETFNVKFTYRQ